MESATPTSEQKQAGVRRPMISKQLRKDLRAYLFLSPWIFSLLVFTAYPMLASFYFSMTKYTVLNPPRWIGLDNFVTMFTSDPLYWRAVGNTTYYTLISVPLGMLVALVLAILLNQRASGIGVYRTIYYLPSLMPVVASTLLWMVLLDPRLGLVNIGLQAIGLPRVGWLNSADWSKPGLILMSLWTGTGTAMLIFLAGLKDVPRSLTEAAMIDGANGWQRFRHVTLPLLTPTIFFNLIMGIIASFQVFGPAYVAGDGGARQAGPLNSLLMYMLLIYRNAFRFFEMGYASALALVMFIVLVLLTLVVVRSSDYWVHYEVGRR
ncbi:MAG TPA: sugar ABC transporter permease [Roseiflexaceae bacterium]|nr:sugar ABC transporter permease [Roseiflexaceae bacterium]HMP42563.1 sugar ABC transporter permease [Roseiflexaceae bacterium]